MTRAKLDLNSYVRDLEEHLQQAVFGGCHLDPEAAVLLVRGALAADDRSRAAELAAATERLTAATPGDGDLAAAAAHVRGLVEQDADALERAARTYSAAVSRAWATEDAGLAWARRDDWAASVARLREAHTRYLQLGDADSAGRVRAQLRSAGIRVQHRRRPDRPAFGWGSLTDTEERIVDLVAQGLSNRKVADQMFLSAHTIAFHLRHVYWKLDITSRVQLAALVAERATAPGPAAAPAAASPQAAAGQLVNALPATNAARSP